MRNKSSLTKHKQKDSKNFISSPYNCKEKAKIQLDYQCSDRETTYSQGISDKKLTLTGKR